MKHCWPTLIKPSHCRNIRIQLLISRARSSFIVMVRLHSSYEYGCKYAARVLNELDVTTESVVTTESSITSESGITFESNVTSESDVTTESGITFESDVTSESVVTIESEFLSNTQ